MKNAGKLRFTLYWTLIGVVYVAAVAYMSLVPDPPSDVLPFPESDKVVHLSVYAFLMLWFGQIYHERPVALLIASGLVALGILLEILQGVSGCRTFGYMDITANTLGVIFGFSIARTRFGGLLYGLEMFLVRSRDCRTNSKSEPGPW